ncbi:hypothetical protein ASPNIDRAFT_44277 [Aspergillus niger ATCC 1015]|uniref:Uncharacterized protein n=1 Tax=Aspergillus niger (strain ATCC 1015 / CBS 113.46 / FGSC A1144 / LSHB Ac4 / NCTC 3858a / NRRL 328 / USDA 3528.7) TaxID=380704 RepID=G3YA29_ASPNA|nr:hypothetical protein ASPNIDRAFT_44277 [Aspergillus niger ATCC 1015]
MPITSVGLGVLAREAKKKAQQEPDALANHCPQVMHHRSNDPPRLDPFAPLNALSKPGSQSSGSQATQASLPVDLLIATSLSLPASPNALTCQPPPPVRLKQLVPLFQMLQGGALLPAFHYSIRSAASTSSCVQGPITIYFCMSLVPDIATTLPQPLPYGPSAVAPTHGGLHTGGGAKARISEGNSSSYAILVRPSPKTADLRHPHMQGIPYPVIYHMDPRPPSSFCLAQH